MIRVDPPEEGFVFVREASPGPMAGAAVGRRVAKADFAPPCIVVDRELSSVIVGGWPGRLYRVAVTPPATDAERAALTQANEGLRQPARYIRAFTVDVLAEWPASALFGPHGAAVVAVLDAARALTPRAAARLAAASTPGAAARYGAAWNRWLTGEPNAAPYLDRDHRHTLAIPGAGPADSPIGKGFLAVSAAVRAAARDRGGPTAFETEYDEDDGQSEEVMAHPWSHALGPLLHAAMALGAPHLMSDADRDALTAPWRATTADRPPR
ncbi:hypothetical protein B4N89_29540 [Embleya scabrispora]|uniref:Uncharacterized protein n=1 Tax=Embleya scabrispora TaxID=159449 RepID=A0A1T3P628_9ACTN|nr:hypothetical protein [Embleya scabrispora]OPC84516.1 hypothetical protein B4N89_29540 [Embleya scabrispora]